MTATILNAKRRNLVGAGAPKGQGELAKSWRRRSLLGPSMVMTEYGYLVGMFLIIFWALDPWRVYLDQIPVIKHFPVVMLLGSLVLTFFGVWIEAKKGRPVAYNLAGIISDFRYLILFASYVIAGSLTAKYVRDIKETFLTMGVFALAAPVTAWFILNSSQPLRTLKLLGVLYVLVALLTAGLATEKFGSADILHNREHLVIPVIGVAIYFVRGTIPKLLAIVAMFGLAAAGAKNTGYLIAVGTTSLLLATQVSVILSKETTPVRVMFARMVAICFVLAASVGTLFLYRKISSLLPSGNPEYRLHMYEVAFDKFRDSPVWGEVFSQSAITHFDLYQVASITQNLPTHSDPLDIAANGGVIGFGLWALALITVIWPAWRLATKSYGSGGGSMLRSLYGFLALTTMGILVSLFNPILNVPNQAFAFWASLGALVAYIRVGSDRKGDALVATDRE